MNRESTLQKAMLIAVGVAVVLAVHGSATEIRAVAKHAAGPVLHYYLPKGRFHLKADFTVKGCQAKYAKKGGKIVAFVPPKVVGSFVLAPEYFPDIEEPMKLDFSGLKSGRRATEVAIKLYPNGTMASINAAVEDKTASIVTGFIKLLTTVLLFASESYDWTEVDLCSETTKEHFEQATEYRATLAELAKARLEVDPTEPNAAAVLSAYQSQVVVVKEQLVSIEKRHLTISVDREWEPTADREAYHVFGLGKKDLMAWYDIEENLIEELRNYFNDVEDVDLGESLPVLFSVLRLDEVSALADVEEARGNWNDFVSGLEPHEVGTVQEALAFENYLKKEARTEETVTYRMPADVQYTFCVGPCPAVKQVGYPGQKVVKGRAFVPQWGGEHRKLNFKAKFAEKRTVGITFGPAGEFTSISWKRNARAGAAATVLAGIAGEAKTLGDTLKNAELARLERELKMYDTKVKLEKAKSDYLALIAEEE